MAITGIKLRSPLFECDTEKFTADKAYSAGDIILFSSRVLIVVNDVASGADGVGVSRCPKALVPKTAGTGITFAVGDKVYCNDTTETVTNSSGGNTLCGRCNVAAGATDTEVEINFNGNVAA